MRRPPRKPAPHFQLCAWYEQVESIMRTDPKRFFLFSPTTKRCLAIYLEMKERDARRHPEKDLSLIA